MNINSQTVIAVVRLAVALIAALGAMFGFAVDAEAVQNIALAVAAIVLLVLVWWKNNNVTKAAQEAQKVLELVKDNAGEWKTVITYQEPYQAQAIYPDSGTDEEAAGEEL